MSTAPEFSAGTPYIGFFESRISDGNEVMIVASVDDPHELCLVVRVAVPDGDSGICLAGKFGASGPEAAELLQVSLDDATDVLRDLFDGPRPPRNV